MHGTDVINLWREQCTMWNVSADLSTPRSIAGFTLGMVSAALLIFYNVPLVAKMVRHKSASAVSLRATLLMALLQVVTLAYAVLEKQVPLVVANVGTLVVTATILILYAVYRPRAQPPSEPDTEVRDGNISTTVPEMT